MKRFILMVLCIMALTIVVPSAPHTCFYPPGDIQALGIENNTTIGCSFSPSVVLNFTPAEGHIMYNLNQEGLSYQSPGWNVVHTPKVFMYNNSSIMSNEAYNTQIYLGGYSMSN